MASDTPSTLLELLRTVIVPLVEIDGGELYLISAGDEEVSLHLAGTCGGCPGAGLTARGVIEPVVRSAAPKAKLHVSNGWQIPKGARRLSAK